MWRPARSVAFLLLLMMLVFIVPLIPTSDYVVRAGGTEVSGVISVDTVWNYSGSPYNVTGDVTIAQNVTLTVESGVEVLFCEGCALHAEGILITLGNLTNRTVFTSVLASKNPGDWTGIRINSTGRASLNFTDIEYPRTALASTSPNPIYVRGGLVRHFQTRGFSIASSADVILLDLNVTGMYPLMYSDAGIYLNSVVNSTISNATIKDVMYGIWIDGADNVSVSDSDLFNNLIGVYCLAQFSSIENNTIHDNQGVGASMAGKTYFAHNEVFRNVEYGVISSWSSGSVFKSNVICSTSCVEPMPPTWGNGHGLVVLCWNPKCSGITIMDNELYGNCGYEIQTHHIINSAISSNNVSGYIRLLSSHFNTIEANRIYSGGIVLEMDQHWLELPSHDNLVRNNEIGPNGYVGIFLDDVYENTITDNLIFDNTNGILLRAASDNLIESNTLARNFYGIRATSGGWIWHPSLLDRIRNNHIFSGGRGIFIEDAYEFEISGNCIYNNTRGMYFASLEGFEHFGSSIVHGNTLLMNNESGHEDGGYVFWNATYPTGGNFWSDYVGSDEFTGPGQDIPGSDGFGDMPYSVDTNHSDYYPLTEPTCSPCGGPDLSVVSQDIMVVEPIPHYPWENLTVNVTVENIGSESATSIVVQVFDGDKEDGSVIEYNQTIGRLQPGERATVTVNWSQPSKGMHLVCALVDPENVILELSKVNNYACTNVYIDEGLPPRPPGNIGAVLSGSAQENVTVRWVPSPDDTGQPSGIVRYDIYESETYSPNRSTYTLIGSVVAGQSSFMHEKRGEGDASSHFYFACGVNGYNLSSCTETQAAKFTRPLVPGLNLISVPLIQSDENVETVLQTVRYDKAWYYDSSSQEWKWYMKDKTYSGGLSGLNHTMALWVNVTQVSNLTLAGIVPAQTTIEMRTGWNIVSFPSFNVSYTVADLKAETGATRVEGYDPAPPYFLRVLGDAEVLLAGLGYWIKVEADTVWTVEVS